MKLVSYQPHRKIYYPAGIISLILLPALCVWWLYQHKAFEPVRAMDVVFFDSSYNERIPVQDRLPLKKNYLEIELTGKDADDSIKLKYAQIMLQQWKTEKDDRHAIDLHFSKTAKYWTIVEAFNMVKAIDVKSYIAYQDHFYASWNFHPKKVEQQPMLSPCGGIIELTCGTSDSPSSWLEKKFTAVKIVLKEYWAPALIFVLMFLSVLVKSRRGSLITAN